MKLPRLYAIADREALEARAMDPSEFVVELLEAGVRMLQYRDKRGSPQEILRTAATISQAAGRYECRLVMNDRADLALLAGWDGVHVGHRDLPPDAARRVIGPAGLVGVSTHNEDQVRAADASTADYIAIGPVFQTGSKADTEPVVGLEGVRRARALTRKPLVAIGGITPGNAQNVVEAGADSLAVIGALLNGHEPPGMAARRFVDLLR